MRTSAFIKKSKTNKKKRNKKKVKVMIFFTKKTPKLLSQLFNYAYLDRLKIIVLFIGWHRT